MEYILSDIENILINEESRESITLDSDEIQHISECIYNTIYKECNFHMMEYKYKEIWKDLIHFETQTYFDMLPVELYDVQTEENIRTIYENVSLLLETQLLPRSEHTIKYPILNNIEMKIENLRKINKNSPKQRTDEWFKIRNNCISASTLWKVLHTQSTKNQIIYEKCVGIKHIKNGIHSPMHWGQKYEQVAQMFYESMYGATIEEYGCIPHPIYPFLGASPDGLNVNQSSSRYGRLLEIKCIKNRELTGIPKKEYWIQMQSQMECCDIDICDFLECRFLEYDNREQFENDGTYTKTANNQVKGLMLCFLDEDNNPIYKYKPIELEKQETEQWIENILENSNYTYVHTYYWYLQEYSCVSVERNRLWFSQILPVVKETWDTILYEREHGCEHRKPASNTERNKVIDMSDSFDSEGKCLVIHVDI